MLLNQMLSTTPPFVINKKIQNKGKKKISTKESEIKTTLYDRNKENTKLKQKQTKKQAKK